MARLSPPLAELTRSHRVVLRRSCPPDGAPPRSLRRSSGSCDSAKEETRSQATALRPCNGHTRRSDSPTPGRVRPPGRAGSSASGRLSAALPPPPSVHAAAARRQGRSPHGGRPRARTYTHQATANAGLPSGPFRGACPAAAAQGPETLRPQAVATTGGGRALTPRLYPMRVRPNAWGRIGAPRRFPFVPLICLDPARAAYPRPLPRRFRLLPRGSA